MIAAIVKDPSALAEMARSRAALAIMLFHAATSGIARQADEGTAAHLWQLLTARQLLVATYYAARCLPRNLRQAPFVLGLQGCAATAALAPVRLLHWWLRSRAPLRVALVRA